MNLGNVTSRCKGRCKASIGADYRPLELAVNELQIDELTLLVTFGHDKVSAHVHASDSVF